MPEKEMMRGSDLTIEFEVTLHRNAVQRFFPALTGIDKSLQTERIKSEPDLQSIPVNFVHKRQQFLDGCQPITLRKRTQMVYQFVTHKDLQKQT
ncbi:MAG: hypothetical protein IPO41_14165 [Acidobacteria bacterium]|nr:hypothetical protein [Acidobacteriota bacterium]